MGTNQFSVEGKIFLVTGASSGIGRQAAITLNQAGAGIVITGRNEERLAETYNMLTGTNNKMVVADLVNDEDITRLATESTAVDGVIHAAGIVELYPTKFLNRKKTEETFAINYFAPMFLMTALFRQKKIKANASIIFMSSFASQNPYPGGTLYSASKAALESYCKVLAVENAKEGLRANCIAPAMVKTPIYDKTVIYKTTPDGDKSEMEEYEKYYLHGFGQPTDVANAILFLASEASRWVTGQTLILDGGYMLGILSKVINM